jgi:precorrin-2 methylase
MRKLLVIGIGAGNPDHMTVQAVDGLDRHVVGIAGADADDEKLAHGDLLPDRRRGVQKYPCPATKGFETLA